LIDFDSIYRNMIKPAVVDAGLEPIRADEERAGGIIHKPMFERLILCDYAVADLTTANANVFYELGIRHAVRPYSTVLLFAEGARLPFDLGPLRSIPYRLGGSGVADAAADRKNLTACLEEAKHANTDSPIFQLVDGMRPPDISHLKTDVFRRRVEYSVKAKEKLAAARKAGVEAVQAVKDDLGTIGDVESGVLIDLLLSFRAVEAWEEMIDLVENMARPVARTVLVQEQYALALNRIGRGEKAERVLNDLLAEKGPSSETYGILGRVYKDRWESARRGGRDMAAAGSLKKAIDAYLKGFQSDWRDAYPGVNCLTLMEIQKQPDPVRLELLPVVRYSIKRRLESGEPSYWDHASRLEVAVLSGDREEAAAALSDALASVGEIWEPKTTLRNLRLIHEAREARGELEPWLVEIEMELNEEIDKRGGGD
jgi:hypothetical protein